MKRQRTLSELCFGKRAKVGEAKSEVQTAQPLSVVSGNGERSPADANGDLKPAARPAATGRTSADSERSSVVNTHSAWHDLGRGSVVGYWPRDIAKHEADQVFQDLLKEVPWKKSTIKIFGKEVLQPREICYMTDPNRAAYSYSGAQMVAEPWHSAVLKLKTLAEERAEAAFNSCLLNLYRDGKDSVSWHADDEPHYGKNCTICSMSFGQHREFQLREKRNHANKRSFNLGHGDVFVMKGTLQANWQHQVPRRANIILPRISLTFRLVKNVK